MTIKPALYLVATAVLTGCATSRQIQGPDGNPAYFIKCGSAVIDACYEKAAEVCPGGYDMLDRGSNPNAVLMPSGAGFMLMRGPNTMFVRCR